MLLKSSLISSKRNFVHVQTHVAITVQNFVPESGIKLEQNYIQELKPYLNFFKMTCICLYGYMLFYFGKKNHHYSLCFCVSRMFTFCAQILLSIVALEVAFSS